MTFFYLIFAIIGGTIYVSNVIEFLLYMCVSMLIASTILSLFCVCTDWASCLFGGLVDNLKELF